MKKNDWILLATVAAYSFLFYKQNAGINFTLFTIMLIIALFIKNKQLIKQNTWKMVAAGSLISSLCVGYYGTDLAIIANVLSVSLLSALSYSPSASVLISLLFSLYSYASAPAMMFLDWQSRKLKSSSSGIKWRLILGPVFITVIFFLMYRASNTLFNNFTKNINPDFISWHWILFTTGGLILSYGFFYHQRIEPLDEMDRNSPNEINPKNLRIVTWFGKEIAIHDEEFSGRLLFILLNALLLIVNALDIQFLFINRQLPGDVTYSEFVHQGTGMLITSIMIAIAIILFYFRGALNFSEKSKFIKTLAYLWIIQNAFMILSTAFRNNMYVMEYGLTYKRIGVYIYLLLTLIGLFTTAIKILKHKSNAFLFRINGWIFYGFLIITTFVNWDRLIIDFNVHKAKQTQRDYLLTLSSTVLPKLYAYETAFSLQKKSTYPPRISFEDERDRHLHFFLRSSRNKSWKSWTVDDWRVLSELKALEVNQKIKKLNFFESRLKSLESLDVFDQLQELDVSYNMLTDVSELENIPTLERLYLQGNKITSLHGIETLQNLRSIDVRYNRLSDYNPLYGLKKLDSVTVDSGISDSQYELLQRNLPETKILKK